MLENGMEVTIVGLESPSGLRLNGKIGFVYQNIIVSGPNDRVSIQLNKAGTRVVSIKRHNIRHVNVANRLQELTHMYAGSRFENLILATALFTIHDPEIVMMRCYEHRNIWSTFCNVGGNPRWGDDGPVVPFVQQTHAIQRLWQEMARGDQSQQSDTCTC